MHKRVENLLNSTSGETFLKIARGALGDSRAKVIGTPTFAEITTSHNDQRTIGIVKVEGTANVAVGSTGSTGDVPWSTVVKVIDPVTVPDGGNAAAWVCVDIEQQVYELNAFGDGAVPFRPARCYLIETRDDDLRVLWLEDLSNGTQPPWDISNYLSAANHLGQFNGSFGNTAQDLPFALSDDMFYQRWGDYTFEADARKISDPENVIFTRQMYRDAPVGAALEFAELTVRILQKARTIPHGIAFGDSHARNLFPSSQQTIGIDWAGLGNDPIGVDAGVLIGSGMTFGIKEAQMVAVNEHIIFDSYLEGLSSGGWDGDLKNVRIGFFGQFAGYMAAIARFAVVLSNMTEDRKPWLETRLGVPFEELAGQLAPAVSLLPKYIEEVEELLK